MDQKLLSIYIGNDVTRVCEVVKKSATMVVVNNATEVSTPNGCIEDGYLNDIPSLAEAIRGCVFGRGFSATRVIFTISSKKIASKEVVIPYVKGEKKIASVLEANSSEYFPMSSTGDFVFAHNIMETYVEDEGKKLRVNAVAAPRDLVEGYYELADELRLTVDNIDYVGNSVLQLLALQMKDNDTELVLQIEKDVTFVNVMSGKDIILQRSVPYGKNAVVNSIMEIKKLTEKEAKTLLSNRDMIDAQVTEEEYAEAVRYLISSIGRIVEYHRSRNPERIIDGIKVFGEGSAIAGIDEVLQQELGAEVTRFDQLQGIKVNSRSYLTADTALRYLANFGAVINPIGLTLQTAKSKERASKAANKILYLLFALAFVIALSVVAVYMFQYYDAKRENDRIVAEIAEKEVARQIEAEWEEAGQAFNIIADFDNNTHSDNVMVTKFFDDVDAGAPKYLLIDEFKSEDGVCKFKFVAPTKESVADFIVFLSNLDYVNKNFVVKFDTEYFDPTAEDTKLWIDATGTNAQIIGEVELTLIDSTFEPIIKADVQPAVQLDENGNPIEAPVEEVVEGGEE